MMGALFFLVSPAETPGIFKPQKSRSQKKNGCPKRESEWMTRRRHNKRLSSDWIYAHSRAERKRERETGGRQSERRRWRNGWKTIPECSALYLLSLHQTSASGSQSTALTYTCTLVDNNSLSSIAAVVYIRRSKGFHISKLGALITTRWLEFRVNAFCFI